MVRAIAVTLLLAADAIAAPALEGVGCDVRIAYSPRGDMAVMVNGKVWIWFLWDGAEP